MATNKAGKELTEDQKTFLWYARRELSYQQHCALRRAYPQWYADYFLNYGHPTQSWMRGTE